MDRGEEAKSRKQNAFEAGATGKPKPIQIWKGGKEKKREEKKRKGKERKGKEKNEITNVHGS